MHPLIVFVIPLKTHCNVSVIGATNKLFIGKLTPSDAEFPFNLKGNC